jgi:anti-anti-sigma factor
MKGLAMAPSGHVQVAVGLLRLRLLEDDEDMLHLSCEGEAVLPDFRDGDEPLVRLLGPGVYGRKVLLNLERVTFLDTSGVTWLVNCHDSCRKAGGRLVLHSVPAQARYVLGLLNLDRVLPLARDAAAGRALLGGRTQ